MKTKIILLILAGSFLAICATKAQTNYIVNGEFDSLRYCPLDLQQDTLNNCPAFGWNQYWTADIYHSCNAWWPTNPQNNQFGSATGNAFAGFLGYPSGEKFMQKLPELYGRYYFSMKIARSTWHTEYANDIKITFENGITLLTPIIDDSNWVFFQGEVTLSGRSMITITAGDSVRGQYWPLGNMNYYYIDAISLTDSPILGIEESHELTDHRRKYINRWGQIEVK